MKCNIEECKKIIDELVFSNPEIKSLLDKGYILPESEIVFDYLRKGQTAIFYKYKYFGNGFITTVRTMNSDDSEYLFGWSGEDALQKAANNVIKELSYHANPDNKEDYERHQYEIYSGFYTGNRYNGD